MPEIEEINMELENFKKSLINLNLSELNLIEVNLINNKNYIKLNILREYIINIFDKNYFC